MHILFFARIRTDFVYNAQMPAGAYTGRLPESLRKP